MSPGEYCRT